MNKEKLKAALYIRVSTEDQTDYSPAAQQKLLVEYAKKNNMEVVPNCIFRDEGFSGKRADKRPAFQKMIGNAKAKPRPFDVILVHKFDRFARNREDSIVFKSMLKREHGIKVVSITESIDDDSPMAGLMEAMLEAMAEYYSINLAKEVKKGMTEKAEQGEYQSSPPLGYVMGDNNVLQINKPEAEYVRFIYTQFLEHGQSPFQIAKHLNAMGVTSKRGNPMDGRGVEYILQNNVYTGMVHWTPTEKTRRNFNHPDTITRQGKHESIISHEIFNMAAEKMKAKIEKGKRKARPITERKHWLSGQVYCSNCGRTLALAASLASPSFQCYGYSHGQCNLSHSITVRKLERAVLGELAEVFKYTDESLFRRKVIKVDSQEQERELIRAQITKVDIRLERAKEAYQAEIDTLEEYKRNKEELMERRSELEAELLQEVELPTPDDTAITEFKANIRNVLELLTTNGNLEAKIKAVGSIIQRIVYDRPNSNLEIYYHSI
jgi:DNA invertase Pin-like site-specific DNA recombinase